MNVTRPSEKRKKKPLRTQEAIPKVIRVMKIPLGCTLKQQMRQHQMPAVKMKVCSRCSSKICAMDVHHWMSLHQLQSI